MNHPYKCPQKVIFPIFDILSGCHFIEENSLHFLLYSLFRGNFRPLWRRCEEFMLFAWFHRKRDFSLYKGNSRDFQQKISGSSQFLTATNFCSCFLKVLTEMLLWCKFQVFWTIFGWFCAHYRSKSGIFHFNFIKEKILHENSQRIVKRNNFYIL